MVNLINVLSVNAEFIIILSIWVIQDLKVWNKMHIWKNDM